MFTIYMQYNHLLFLYSITEITPGKAVILLSDCGFNFKSNWNRLTSILNVPLEQKATGMPSVAQICSALFRLLEHWEDPRLPTKRK